MPLFKKKLDSRQVTTILIQSLNIPLESIPNAPVITQVTRETVKEEAIFLQGFIVHLVTSARLFGSQHSNAVLDEFWGELYKGEVFDEKFNERIEGYKWSYENLYDLRGTQYCIGVTFAGNCGAEDGEPLDFFTEVGTNLFSDGMNRLQKFYDSIKIVS